MDILIFDDNIEFINQLQLLIGEINAENNNPFQIKCSETKAERVLDYARKNINESVYLLDIIADNEPIGFKLAGQIKIYNENNIVIYLTDYPSKIVYSAYHKLTCESFILKKSHNFKSELQQSLLYVYKTHHNNCFIIAENNKRVCKVCLKDIYYFEKIKESHHLCVVYKNGYAVFSGTLNNVLKKLNKKFCYSHRSFIVNTDNMKEVDKKSHVIYFDNGQSCPYSLLYQRNLSKWTL